MYLHREVNFSNEMSLDTSLFFQPSTDDPKDDYKASLLVSFNIPVSENFNIQIQFSESIDKDPPELADESDQSLSTNFNYNF